MKKIFVTLALFLSVFSVAAKAYDIPEDVKESIRFRIAHGYNVGIVVGIVSQAGRQYYSYGKTALSGNQELNENTLFEIGSFTKVFTALLLADMVEQGEVAFHDQIEKYLPETVGVPKHNGKSITLVHLATHTSGLPRIPDNMNFTDPNNPYVDYSVKQMYEFLSNHTLRQDIGQKFEYSNFGMGLLGHILELRSGMTYEQLIKQRIANELDMDDTVITLTTEMRKRLAKGHSGNIEVSNWDFLALKGAGALRSTAHDMLTFLAANMGLKKSSLHMAMKTTHEPRYEAGSEIMHIGLGWHILSIDDSQLIWHNGGTGGYWFFGGFDKAEQKGVVVLTNSGQTIDDIGFHLLEPDFPLSQLDPNFPLHRTQLLAEPVVVDLAPGEKLPTGNEIMKRYIKSIGGCGALAKIKNRLISWTMQMKSLGVAGTMVVSQARPKKYHLKMDIAGLVTIEQGTDGKVVWELNPMTGSKILKGKERATMLLHYRFDDTDYEQLYKKIECVGLEKIGDDVCYKVVFTPRQAAPFTAYFSKASGLMMKTVIALPGQLDQIKVESFMSDYKQVDGILYPYQVIERVMNMDIHYTVESLKHNVQMPEDRFEPPAEIKKLLEHSEEKRE